MGQDMKVWKQVFQELIREVKPWHTWKLTLDKNLLPNILKPGWKQYQQWTFARFQCSSCSRNWASAQVQVLFHMHWSEGESRGQVKMRVFAQRCQKCSQASFEVPKFTEENISRILNNLVLQILKKCYREGFMLEDIPMIKEISLEGPHDSNNCEACLHGFCAQSELGPVSLISLLPPTRSSTILGITTETPSPTRSSTRGDAVKKKKVLPRPWFPKPARAESLPTSWSPRANTDFQAERRDNNFDNCTFNSYTAQPTRSLGVNCCCCSCCLILIIILIVIIVTVVKTTI
ncbi:receptor-transporting protein 3 [Hippopotamus amphibius kiboko]|uniref:receptor-transporting protein 3 n=1 Tax=Hippopotamus amphibius kiboko TaxID=575201 RepID=UPI00259500CE|nr:receptor-transporting protein 3 [Hippopotamus amphibius kiboko]